MNGDREMYLLEEEEEEEERDEGEDDDDNDEALPTLETIYWSDRMADNMREIPPNEELVLFTPVLTPWKGASETMGGKPGEPIVDAFDCLSKELHYRHGTVNQIPYLPGIGFTDHHDRWTTIAAGVVVVNCEPVSADMASKATSMALQRNFASAVSAKLDDMFGSPLHDDPCPLALVHLADEEYTHFHGYEIVLQCDTWSRQVAKDVAVQLLVP